MIFYENYNIGFIARPHPSKHKRNGRFKKAGNLNFSMNYYNNQQFKDLGAIYWGDLLFGEYILLIDSDTRLPDFPTNENGCIKRVIKDLVYDGQDKILYAQCFIGPYLSTNSVSEKCIYNFTSQIYNGILVNTSLNSIVPLVGHNVFLNFKLLENIAIVDPTTKYKYYWSEDKISEDFDCMLRGSIHGYIGRYITSAGIFYEGIPFNYITEYFKLSKFACGAAELTFNPIAMWPKHFIFSSDIIKFIRCKEIEWYNKLNILSYIFNFIAIAQSHFALFYNLLFFDRLMLIYPTVLLPINLMWESMFCWFVVNTILNIFFSIKMKFNVINTLKQQFREIFFTTFLYGSLSVKFSIMYFVHLFNLKIEFGATQKDENKITLKDWTISTKYESAIYIFYLSCITMRLAFFPVESLANTFYYGCLPLLINVAFFWLGPITYDILSIKKTNQVFDEDTKMFNDKYKTQILHSKVFGSEK
jgi:hypothetical protein